MTQPDASRTAALTVEELRRHSARLGLTWQLVPATVLEVSTDSVADPIIVSYDGDPNEQVVPASAVSLIGTRAVGERVMVLVTPPAGTYIVGSIAARAFGGGSFEGLAGTLASGTTTSTSFAQVPGGGALTLAKSPLSELLVDMHCTFFAAGSAAGTEFGVNVVGATSGDGDYLVSKLEDTVAVGVRLQASGTRIIAGVGGGTLTITPVWRRTSGLGVPTTVAGDDYLSLTVEERFRGGA